VIGILSLREAADANSFSTWTLMTPPVASSFSARSAFAWSRNPRGNHDRTP